MKTLCAFCGSNKGQTPVYEQASIALADEMLKNGLNLAYGGARVGLMGVLANRYLEKKGHAIGVMPKFLADVEIAHNDLGELHIVDTMHERKQLLSQLSDAFVMLPGGVGSLEEFFEVWTWMQLGLQVKPFAIYNIDGYFDLLIQFLDKSVEEGFVKAEHRAVVIISDDPVDLVHQLKTVELKVTPKWMDLEELAEASN